MAKISKLDNDDILKYLTTKQQHYTLQRNAREDTWLECWAAYIGSVDAVDYLRNRVGKIVGNVNDDWRHKITTGKAYELVETALSYLVSAFFPNDDYFDFIPSQPGYTEIVDIIKRYLQYQLRDSGFKTHFESYLRQLLITGHSAIACTWSRGTSSMGKYNKPKFEVLNIFDVLFDLRGKDTSVIRRINLTKSEVLQRYPQLDTMQVVKYRSEFPNKESNQQQSFLGVSYNPHDLVTVYEYWGDIVDCDNEVHKDRYVLWFDKQIIKHTSIPFDCGVPFIIGSCTPVPNTAVGMGILEPVLGLLHQLNIITNQRLDSLELAIDTMWLHVPDGVTDVDELHTTPGKVIKVGSPNALVPVSKDMSFTVSYDEARVLEQAIERATGLLPFVGSQPGRTGERVTATEVQAVRDVGGVRLSGIFNYIEHSQFIPLLKIVFYLTKQFTDTDTIIRSPRTGGGYEYIKVGEPELAIEGMVVPKSANHVVQREKDLRQILDFVNAVASIPPWVEQINWDYLLEELARRFQFSSEQVAQLIKKPMSGDEQQLQPEPLPLDLEGQLLKGQNDALMTAQKIGGKPQVDTMVANAALTGVDPATQMTNTMMGKQ